MPRASVIPFKPVRPSLAERDVELCMGDMLTVLEAVAMSKLSRVTLFRAMKAGELPYVQEAARGHRLIPKRSLAEYLAERLKRG